MHYVVRLAWRFFFNIQDSSRTQQCRLFSQSRQAGVSLSKLNQAGRVAELPSATHCSYWVADLEFARCLGTYHAEVSVHSLIRAWIGDDRDSSTSAYHHTLLNWCQDPKSSCGSYSACRDHTQLVGLPSHIPAQSCPGSLERQMPQVVGYHIDGERRSLPSGSAHDHRASRQLARWFISLIL